ncbi:MAG: protein translocase subunit SecD [Candidatus Omnitrophica bacterium]|nr:protein translocase subunit SecD [Candidatus Omnitrophota bacterium]MDD5573946.1 protein translocase subunit SecD [Candidatus Omnitrophota bacterium]
MQKSLLYRGLLIAGVILAAVLLAFPLNKRINLGLDLQGGMYLILRVDTSLLSEKAKEDAVERALEIIRNRIDEFGVREPVVQIQGADQIVIQLPGMTDRKRALELIGRTALLEFKLVSNDTKVISEALAGKVPEGFELKELEGEKLLLSRVPELTGEYLETADVRFDQSSFGQPIVGMNLKGDGVKKFAELTKNNVGRRLAIVLDGRIYSAPRINEPIPTGEAVISGRFTPDEAKDLAIVLRSGALPAPLVIEEERTVGPQLGQDSIHKGLMACLIGAALVFLFMLFYYGATGLIANAALLLNILIILGGLGLFHATLTLPGIAGIILTIGMAVDANVLINERIRDEMKSGRPLRTAVANGYDKAFSAIFDSNATTLIAAFFLFQFGTGPIRGFAVTLTIGLLASLFTAIVVTRFIFDILLFKNAVKTVLFKTLIKDETHVDFIKKRYFAYALSALILVVGIVSFVKRGGAAFGVEFSGGQLQEYRFQTPVPIEQLRGAMKEAGLADVNIQQVKEDPRQVILRSGEDSADAVQAGLRKSFPGNDVEVMRIEKIGPTVGRELKKKALLAIVYSLIGILLYVAIRFKHLDFAVGGVFALLHDVVLTAGFIAFMNRQIDLLIVTALLTIAGYSINDTIVIYDRVRELMRTKFKVGLRDVINLALNQTLSRTILTSFATLLVVVAMFLLGGEILNSFALTLLFGFVIGCYSTIFVASPIVLACRGLMKPGR